MGSKAKEGAKAMSLAFVLLDFQHAGVSKSLDRFAEVSSLSVHHLTDLRLSVPHLTDMQRSVELDLCISTSFDRFAVSRA